MNKIKLLFPILILLTFSKPTLIYSSPNYINLQNALNSEGSSLGIEFKIENLGTIIMRSMETLLLITGLWMFICIIWSGLEWQFARGNKSELDKAKTRLTNCTLGLTVICLAYALILVVQYVFGLDGLFPNTP